MWREKKKKRSAYTIEWNENIICTKYEGDLKIPGPRNCSKTYKRYDVYRFELFCQNSEQEM